MSHISKSALGLIAASLAFGGVGMGLASDLGSAADKSLLTAAAVNRASKADREAFVPEQSETVTLSFRLPNLSDASVTMRLPIADARRLRPGETTTVKGGAMRSKMIVACEPVVSVLTAVAKQLGPGRCIT